jgi:hypothetical protein
MLKLLFPVHHCRCVNHYLISETDCAQYNGTFYFPSDSKEECLRYSYCQSLQSSFTGLLSPPNEMGRCSEGEKMRSLFDWNEAKWIGGTWAYTNWTKREALSANEIRPTTNFTHLQSFVSIPSALSLKTYLQNQVFDEIDKRETR